MSYVRNTGREYARRRRERRSHVIIGVAAAIMLCGFGYAIAYAAGVAPGSQYAHSGPSCTTTITKAPQSRVVVNLYNASTTQGQATSLRKSLASRNFDVGVVSNDPYKEHITGVGEIRTGTESEQFARTYVLPLTPGAKIVVDGRTGTSVDIVLGDNFTVPSAAKSTATAAPSTNCATTYVD